MNILPKLFVVFCFFAMNISVFATNPTSGDLKNLINTQQEIDLELQELNLISDYIEKNGYNFQQLSQNNQTGVSISNLKSSANEGVFWRSNSDVPLGIPGFWWGFCLGLIGMIIVYVAMDEGADRKHQVKNSLWGCLIGSLIGFLFYALVFAATFGDAAKDLPNVINVV